MSRLDKPLEEQEPNLDLLRPVPLELPNTEGWQSIEIEENGEPLVALGPYAGNRFDRLMTDSLYAGERENSPYRPQKLEGSLLGVYVREGVAEKLWQAEQQLPRGMHLVVWDGYRPLEVQQSLYEVYRDELKRQHPDWDDTALDRETQQYVSLPSADPDKPSPHNTGGSVDLDIVKVPMMVEQRIEEIDNSLEAIGNDTSQWSEVYLLTGERKFLLAKHSTTLNFGAARDHGGPASALNHFELLSQDRPLTDEEREARDNRRVLYNAMRAVGMEAFPSEFWHYNAPESQMGAKTAGREVAEYGAGTFSADNQAYEEMRRKHLKGTVKVAENRGRATKLPNPKLGIVHREVKLTGHPRKTTLPEAEEISPPEAA